MKLMDKVFYGTNYAEKMYKLMGEICKKQIRIDLDTYASPLFNGLLMEKENNKITVKLRQNVEGLLNKDPYVMLHWMGAVNSIVHKEEFKVVIDLEKDNLLTIHYKLNKLNKDFNVFAINRKTISIPDIVDYLEVAVLSKS